jgi:SNF2 family DNA or RNA helicase
MLLRMGCGKSLQVIALIWTLLKDGPKRVPIISKVKIYRTALTAAHCALLFGSDQACVVCPSTLVSHWADEFKKWLGTQRIQTCTLQADGEDGQTQTKENGQRMNTTERQAATVERWTRSKVTPVLIASYEMVCGALSLVISSSCLVLVLSVSKAL